MSKDDHSTNTQHERYATSNTLTAAKRLHLVDRSGADELVIEPIRKGFGRGLKQAAEQFDYVVGLCADLTESTQMHLFAEAFPQRFVEVGVAEQGLTTAAAGMAAEGMVPFASSYAAFCPGRSWEQFKTTACLNELPVKIVGSHAGLMTGPDGATHQMLEDISLMRALPNNIVIVPGDSVEAQKATLALAADKKNPSYLRLARDGSPILTTAETPFEIGKAYVWEEGADVTIIATGTMTYQALLAADMLYKDGIEAEVIHVPTIKPLDHVTILKSIAKTRAVITCEEGQIIGGLGSAIAELVSENHPVPLRRIGVRDKFGETGKPAELFEKFGLTPRHIALAAHDLITVKK